LQGIDYFFVVPAGEAGQPNRAILAGNGLGYSWKKKKLHGSWFQVQGLSKVSVVGIWNLKKPRLLILVAFLFSLFSLKLVVPAEISDSAIS